MRDALVFTKEAPVTTLTVDSTVYIGKHQIRRNVGRSTSLYIAGSVTDDYVTIDAGQQVGLNAFAGLARTFNAVVVQTNGQLQAIIDGNPIMVNKVLVIDTSAKDIVLANLGASAVEVHVTYSVAGPAAASITLNPVEAYMPLSEAVAGFAISGSTNVTDAPVVLTLNNSQYPLAVQPDGTFVFTVPANTVTTVGPVFFTVASKDASTITRLDVIP